MSAIPHKPRLSITERDILIRNHYTRQQARYIYATLSKGDMEVIEDTNMMDFRDYLAVAITRQTRNNQRLKTRFQKLVPISPHDYYQREIAWLSEMKYLVGTRKGEPTTNDLTQEIKENNISDTFRAYYCIRFSNRVQPKLSH